MTRSLLMSALISLCCYNNLLADKDIAELGAEHFAKCSGLFAAAAVREERMGQTNKAYQFMRLSNGARISATLSATRKHGRNSKSWAHEESKLQREIFLNHLIDSEYKLTVYFNSQMDRCYSTLETQKQLLDMIRERTYRQVN